MQARQNREQTAIDTSDGSHELSEEEKQHHHEQSANGIPPPSTSNSEFPDGGRQAWLVVAGAWVCFFVSYGFISSAGVYQDYYQRTLLRDYSPSAISWIPSIQLFALSASAPFVGRFFDGHGPNVPVAVGSFMLTFGMMMQSLSTQYYQLLLSQAILTICTIRSRLQHSAKPFNIMQFLRPFTDLAFDLNVLGCFFGSMGMLLPFNFLKVAAEAADVSPSLTPYLLPILNAVR
ncbi:major facilitator superfamily transporter [Seiridium cupressi]